MQGRVLYLAEDPGLVVSDRVILDCLVRQLFFQPVHHLDLLKAQNHSAAGAALPKDPGTGMSVTLSVCIVTCTAE
jgi:hypothetical protein